MNPRPEQQTITYSAGGNRDTIIATLKISMPISQWRGMAKEAAATLGKDNDFKLGNVYACQLRWAIEQILREAEMKYIEFHDETAEVRKRFVGAVLDCGIED